MTLSGSVVAGSLIANWPCSHHTAFGFKTQLFFSDGPSVHNSLISTRLEQMNSVSPILVTDEVLTAIHHQICSDALFHGDLAHLIKELKKKIIHLRTFLNLRSTGSTIKHKHHFCPAQKGSCNCCLALAELTSTCHSAMNTLFATGF